MQIDDNASTVMLKMWKTFIVDGKEEKKINGRILNAETFIM